MNAVIPTVAALAILGLCLYFANKWKRDPDLCPTCDLHLRYIDADTGFSLSECIGCATDRFKRYQP